MGFLGGITVELEVSDFKVVNASVHPDKEVKAEKVLFGKEPVKAISLVENLFALCPLSQRAAAEAAISTAIEERMSTALQEELSRRIQGERIAEGFRFFVLQLPDAKWRQANTSTIVPLWKLVRELNQKAQSASDWSALQETLSVRLGDFLKEAFEGSWENDILNGTFRDSTSGIVSIFAKLSKYRTIGWSAIPPLKVSNEVFLSNLKSTKTSLEKLSAGPFNHFTGAIARMRKAPLTDALLKTDGPSAYTRFAARFEELLHDLENPPVPAQLVSSLDLDNLSAISMVQNSRGVLLHYVKLEKSSDDKTTIADYCILTPTEINVTKAPSFTKSLQGITGATEKEIEELANLVTLSYDPCTEIKMEINHA